MSIRVRFMSVRASIAVGILAIFSSLALAQSLRDKEYFTDQEKYLADDVKSTNERCGMSLAAKFDWSKPPTPEERRVNSAYGYCGAVLEALRRTCDAAAGKEAVKQKVKSFTCGFGPQRTISLKEGAIDYKVNFNSSGDADFVYGYLQNNL